MSPAANPTSPTAPQEPFAVVVKRRLVGLMVLLLAGFLLSSVLQRGVLPEAQTSTDGALQTIVVPIGGTTAAESAAEQIAPQ